MPTNADARTVTRLHYSGTGPQTHEIGPGVYLDLPLEVQITDCPDPGVTVTLVITEVDGKLAPVSVSCADGLSTDRLRRLNMATLVNKVIRAFAEVDGDNPDGTVSRMNPNIAAMSPLPDQARIMRLEGPTDANLRRIARLYRAADVVGERPTKWVAMNVGLPTSTAGNWVRKARDAGYLNEVGE
jgi:hypothetical protein